MLSDIVWSTALATFRLFAAFAQVWRTAREKFVEERLVMYLPPRSPHRADRYPQLRSARPTAARLWEAA